MITPIHPETRIGHVHLKVSDLERSVEFYTNVLGFEITARMGSSAAFLSAGGYHHHIGLNTWESYKGAPPPSGSTGLYHVAIVLPSRKELARAVQRLEEHGYQIDGAADHGVSEAIYLRDPDENGLELYADTPKSDWQYDANGTLQMYTRHLDYDSLMAELSN